ncbi:hypothetical protein TrST_g6968 [Triparma strigata]|uniref:Kinesin motor domain-containing protein n=1 Tax=Triparma strigata TaxID=1606541 RepID=A0A9W7EJG2_9STRA|nr:hypothetical protein TrST_g6968 [Triparma strigata]
MPTVEEKEAELAALQATFDEYVESSKELETELESELEKLETQLTEALESNEDLTSTNKKLKADLNKIGDSHTESHNSLSSEVKSLTQKLQAAEQLADDSENGLRAKSESERKLQIELDDALEQVAFHVTELEDLRAAMSGQAKDKEEELKEMEGDMATLRVKLEEAESSKSANGGDGDTHDTQAETERLKKELEETQLMAEEALLSSESLTDEVEKLKAKEKQTEDTANLLNEAIAHSEEQVTELEETKALLNEAVSHSEELSNELEKIKKEGTQYSSELDEANKMLDEAVTHSEELSVELEGLKSKMKQNSPKKEREEGLKAELEKSVKDLEDTKKKLKSASELATVAATKLESVTAELSEAKGAQAMMSPSKDLEHAKNQLLEAEKAKNDTIAKLTSTKATLAATIVSQQQATSEMSDYKSALANMSIESNELQKVEAELRAEVAQLKADLEKAEAAPPPPPPPSPPPQDQVISNQRLKALAEKNSELGSTISLQASQIQTLTASLAHLKRVIAEASSSSGDDPTSSPVPKLPPPPSFSPAITSSPVLKSSSTITSLSNSSMQDLVEQALAAPSDVNRTSSALKTLLQKCTAQKTTNAHLLSKIQKISNSIQVCCRIRPLRNNELRNNEKVVVEPLSETEAGYYDQKAKQWKSFVYDKVFGPDQSQQDIFEEVEPLCLSVVDGYNACIFAYGQTGSGKTYTMEGFADNNQWGICVRTLHKIFEILDFRKASHVAVPPLGDNLVEIDNSDDDDDDDSGDITRTTGQAPQFNYQIEIGMLEIYNEDVRDLLSPDLVSVDLKRDSAGKIQVPNLTRREVMSLNDVMDVMSQGKKYRAVAATNMNDQSSRSHMILSAMVSSWIDGQPRSTGQLYLVDLAGSERVNKSGVQNKELKEAQHINLSLSALGDVMEALDKKSSHVPYRNSKLTYCLQDSLGGNSRTMMIVNVCPSSSSGEESLCAMQFASRVRRITMSAATRNVGGKNLEEILRKLRFELRETIKARDSADSEVKRLGAVAKQMQARLSTTLSNKSKADAEESKTTQSKIAVLQRNNADITSRWQKEKHLKEEQVIQIENLQREIRRIQQQMSKAVRDREAMSKKLLEREQQLLAVNRENRQAMVASKSGVGTAVPKQSNVFDRFSNNENNGNGEDEFGLGGTVKKKRRGVDGRGGGSGTGTGTPQRVELGEPQTIEDMKEEISELLRKHEPTKLDKLQDLFQKFVGKEDILLEKMRRRYARLATPGKGQGQRQQMAFDKSISRMKG